MQDYTLSLMDEAATLTLGQEFAQALQSPCVVYLNGDLGAGKTTFTRGFLRGLGYDGLVKSPTYTLVESYEFVQKKVHHFDLYRFVDPEEWLDSGLDELFTQQSIILVEWPQKAAGVLPLSDLNLDFSVQNQGRVCTIITNSTYGEQYFAKWLTLHDDIF